MQFLKILFWCLLAFLAAVFTLGNWSTVPIRLWGGLIAEVNLPLLLLLTFLAGLLPTLAWQGAVRWRLRQRLTTVERALADGHPVAAAEPPPVAPASAAAATMAAPTAVPPDVA